MRLVLIGAGNVATILGKLFRLNGHEIAGVYSRNPEHAAMLAKELACDWGDLNNLQGLQADLFIMALTDAGIHEISSHIQLGHQSVVHTAGAIPLNILEKISTQYGVFYPLQSLRKEFIGDQLPEIPILIDGNSDGLIAQLQILARSISSKVQIANDHQRLCLHIGGVMVNNFTNHLYSLTESFCKAEKVDFKLLQPIIEDTALRLRNFSPGEVQTGPAVRKDMATIKQHLEVLKGYKEIEELYRKMTEGIVGRG